MRDSVVSLVQMITAVILFLLVQSCYVTKQAYVQGGLLLSAEDVDDYKASSEANPKIVKKLNILENLLKFSSEYGLEANGSYEEIVFPEGGKVSFLAISAEYNSLEPDTYWFPFVGTVPYKGFFAESDRDEYIAKLKKMGKDTAASDVGAFSLLGYFDDPIFPSMLRKSEADMAHLFFHELTHKTVWIPNAAEFNEQLAEFVAMKISKEYILKRKLSRSIHFYEKKNNDRNKFGKWVDSLKSELSALYSIASLNRIELILRKKKIIDNHIKNKPKFEAVDFIGNKEWNNARIAIVSTYGTNYDNYDASYECISGAENEKTKMRYFLEKIVENKSNLGSSDKLKEIFCSKQLAEEA